MNAVPKPRPPATDDDPYASVSGSVSAKPELAIYRGPEAPGETTEGHEYVDPDSLEPDNLEPDNLDNVPQRELQERRSQRVAVVYLLIAWLLGTVLFETIAFGFDARMTTRPEDQVRGTADPNSCSELPFSRSLRREATMSSLANSGIASFVRLDRNSRLCATFDQIIRTETVRVAMLDSIREVRRAPSMIQVDPDAIAVDPVVDSMPVTKVDITNAFRKLDMSQNLLLLSDRSRDRMVWENAKKSSLPGLIRLAAYRTQSAESLHGVNAGSKSHNDDPISRETGPTSSAETKSSDAEMDASPNKPTPKRNTSSRSSPKTFVGPESAACIVRARPHRLPKKSPPSTTRTSYIVDSEEGELK